MQRVACQLAVGFGFTLVLGAATAGAVTTYSPPVRSSEGDVLACIVQNLSDATVSVTGELNNGQGSVSDEATLNVGPGQTLALASSADALFGAYCRFDFNGDADLIRGYIRLFDFGGSNTRLLYRATLAPGGQGGDRTTYSPAARATCSAVPCRTSATRRSRSARRSRTAAARRWRARRSRWRPAVRR